MSPDRRPFGLMSPAWLARALGLLCLALSGWLAPPPANAAGPSTLRFCIDQASPLAGRDRAVAVAAAAAVGHPAELIAFDSAKAGENGLYGAALTRVTAECDLIMGMPLELPAKQAPSGFTLAAAYARTGFVLVTRGEAPPPLDSLAAGTRVAVTYLGFQRLFIAGRPELQAVIGGTDEDSLAALAAGRASAAIVWQPSLIAFGGARHDGFRGRLLRQQHAEWVVGALRRVDSADRAPGALFAQGIAKLRALQGKDGLADLIAPLGLPPDPPPSSEAGIFSATQTEAGAKVYMAHCAACHGAHLEGVVGPPLKGQGFASESMDYTVGAIFTFLATQMPAGLPGSLSHGEYADVMAFILKENGYRSGSSRLSFAQASASTVPLVSQVQ